MKRKHRLSGDPTSQQMNLRKAQSVGLGGHFLPLKSRDDHHSITNKPKIRYDSESGISNEAFEANEEEEILSSNEHII